MTVIHSLSSSNETVWMCFIGKLPCKVSGFVGEREILLETKQNLLENEKLWTASQILNLSLWKQNLSLGSVSEFDAVILNSSG